MVKSDDVSLDLRSQVLDLLDLLCALLRMPIAQEVVVIDVFEVLLRPLDNLVAERISSLVGAAF